MYKIINRKKLIATVIADTIGKILFFPRSLIRRPKPIRPEAVHNICIIKTAYIGDVVMTLPILAPLKKKFPNASITFVTSTGAAPLLQNNPYVDKILTFDPFWFYHSSVNSWLSFIKTLRNLDVDLVLETRGDIREILLLVFWIRAQYKIGYDIGGGAWLLTHVVPYRGIGHKVKFHLDMVNYLGAPLDISSPILFVTDREQQRVCDILQSKGISGPFIAVHPGSRLASKRWPRERFARLCDILSVRFNMPIVLLGAAHEKGLVDSIKTSAKKQIISLAGEISLRELAALIGSAAIFICNDSAPMHIAAAMKTPTVAIFGPSKKRETGPYMTESEVVEKDFPCRFSCDETSCRLPEFRACMQAIEVEDVVIAADRLWRRCGQPTVGRGVLPEKNIYMPT